MAECDLPNDHKAKVSVDSSKDDGALLVSGLIAGGMCPNWIVDSGTTSHMYAMTKICLCLIRSSKNQRK